MFQGKIDNKKKKTDTSWALLERLQISTIISGKNLSVYNKNLKNLDFQWFNLTFRNLSSRNNYEFVKSWHTELFIFILLKIDNEITNFNIQKERMVMFSNNVILFTHYNSLKSPNLFLKTYMFTCNNMEKCVGSVQSERIFYSIWNNLIKIT